MLQRDCVLYTCMHSDAEPSSAASNSGAIAGGVIGGAVILILVSVSALVLLLALARGIAKRGVTIGQYVEFKK